MIVGYCYQCGSPVYAHHENAGAVQRTCSGHVLDYAMIEPQGKPSAADSAPKEEK